MIYFTIMLTILVFHFEKDIRTFLTSSDRTIKAQAIQAEIEGMKAGNQEWEFAGKGIEHDEQAFYTKSDELLELLK